MKKQENIKNNMALNSSIYEISLCNNLQPLDNKELNSQSKLIGLRKFKVYNKNTEPGSVKQAENQIIKKTSQLPFQNSFDEEPLPADNLGCKNLFRFFVKNGEHVYGRSNDIIMMESCDHLVNVYLALNDKLKKTIRANTLKDFLLLLPANQFIRISRFCAINIHRLSGGNWHEQTFEFDFNVSVKLKHALPQAVFKNIGK